MRGTPKTFRIIHISIFIAMIPSLWGNAAAQNALDQEPCSAGKNVLNRKCTVPNYRGLSDKTKSDLTQLGVTEKQWDFLSNNQRLGFFNLRGAITRLKLTLEGLQVDWDHGKGIQQDRIFLRTARSFFSQTQNLDGAFSGDIGKGAKHGDYFISFRHDKLYKSLQLSFVRKRNRVDSDIDIFNPNLKAKNGVFLGAILHGIEVLSNRLSKALGGSGKTSPYSVAFRTCWECASKP